MPKHWEHKFKVDSLVSYRPDLVGENTRRGCESLAAS